MTLFTYEYVFSADPETLQGEEYRSRILRNLMKLGYQNVEFEFDDDYKITGYLNLLTDRELQSHAFWLLHEMGLYLLDKRTVDKLC